LNWAAVPSCGSPCADAIDVQDFLREVSAQERRASDTEMNDKRAVILICASVVLVVWIYCYASSATPDEGEQWSAWTYKGDKLLSHGLFGVSWCWND